MEHQQERRSLIRQSIPQRLGQRHTSDVKVLKLRSLSRPASQYLRALVTWLAGRKSCTSALAGPVIRPHRLASCKICRTPRLGIDPAFWGITQGALPPAGVPHWLLEEQISWRFARPSFVQPTSPPTNRRDGLLLKRRMTPLINCGCWSSVSFL